MERTSRDWLEELLELFRENLPISSHSAAIMLVGAARDYAFTSAFLGEPVAPPADFARQVAEAIVAGIAPKRTTIVGGRP